MPSLKICAIQTQHTLTQEKLSFDWQYNRLICLAFGWHVWMCAQLYVRIGWLFRCLCFPKLVGTKFVVNCQHQQNELQNLDQLFWLVPPLCPVLARSYWPGRGRRGNIETFRDRAANRLRAIVIEQLFAEHWGYFEIFWSICRDYVRWCALLEIFCGLGAVRPIYEAVIVAADIHVSYLSDVSSAA